MQTCYLEHNILIDCIKDEGLRAATINATVHDYQFVFAPIHIYEIGNAGIANAPPLVKLIESLRPAWLMSRIDIQCAEFVRAWLHFWTGEDEKAEISATLTEVVSIINGFPIPPVLETPLMQHVEQFTQEGAQYMNPLHTRMQATARENQRATAEGKFTHKRREIDVKYVVQMLTLVQYGICDDVLHREHLKMFWENEAVVEQALSFVVHGGMHKLHSQQIEQLLAEELHGRIASFDKNSQNDREHAIYALPNCNLFVTNDKKLLKIVEKISLCVDFPIAETMNLKTFRDLCR